MRLKELTIKTLACKIGCPGKGSSRDIQIRDQAPAGNVQSVLSSGYAGFVQIAKADGLIYKIVLDNLIERVPPSGTIEQAKLCLAIEQT